MSTATRWASPARSTFGAPSSASTRTASPRPTVWAMWPRWLSGRPASGRCCEGHLVPRPPFELATAGLRRAAAPLLEEERHRGGHAAVADVERPLRVHRTGIAAALTADDDPVDPVEFERWHRPEQRLD